jgi:hypothetical protein
MDQLTYQQILAEQYEENARNLLVFQEEGNDEGEDIESHEETDYRGDYDDYEVEKPEEFNRVQDRHNLKNVIKPDQRDTPSELKRNTNIRNLVLNIDGQFRGNIVPGETFNCTGTVNTGTKTTGTTSSEFTFMGSRLYKNVTSIKMTSCEFHNVFYTFSKERGNTSFTVFDTATNITYDVQLLVTEGANYATPQLFEAAINAAILAAGVPGLTVVYDADQHRFSFIGLTATITFPTTTNNPNGNGIGYNLGFLKKSYTSGVFTGIEAEGAPDLIQDRYVYLDINKWNVVEHQQYGQTFFPVFAKLQLNQPKNATVFTGNYIDSSTKEYYFQQPENLQRFDIRILDAYGNVLNMRNANISLTLEVRETYDFPSYEKVRALM